MSYEVETVDYRDGNLIAVTATPVDEDEIQLQFDIDTSGAAAGNALVFDGSNLSWAEPVSQVDLCFAFMMGGS